MTLRNYLKRYIKIWFLGRPPKYSSYTEITRNALARNRERIQLSVTANNALLRRLLGDPTPSVDNFEDKYLK